MQVLNFYSTVFADQMKRGRKTATIRLGDKRHKYRKNQVVLVTVGYQYSPREKLFHAVIDNVEVKRVKDLSPRDIEHDNPEFRRTEELVHFLKQIYDREVGARRHRDGRAVLADRREPAGLPGPPARRRRRPELDVERLHRDPASAATSSPGSRWHSCEKSANCALDDLNFRRIMIGRWHSRTESAKSFTLVPI